MECAEKFVEISNEHLQVLIRPEKGCDIVSLRHRERDVELLWRTPWGLRRPGTGAFPSGSEMHWIQASGGGWNLLFPNAGPEREHGTAPFGFHGEAALVPWNVDEASSTHAVFSTVLVTAPVHIRRTIRLDADTLVVEEEIANQSPDATSFSWGHHPTLGHEFVEEGTRLEISGATIETDPAYALNGSPGGTVGPWPQVGETDVSIVPPDAEGRVLLAYLSDLDDGSYRVINDRRGIGLEVRWPLEIFPHLWLWQELYGTSAFPWFRRTYALALEPHSTIPQTGRPPITLQGNASIAATVSARVFSV